MLCPNLNFTVENEGNLNEIRLFTFQTQYSIMNEIFDFLEF